MPPPLGEFRAMCLSVYILQIMKWCEQHKDDPPFEEEDYNESDKMPAIPKIEDFTEWDKEFFNVSTNR